MFLQPRNIFSLLLYVGYRVETANRFMSLSSRPVTVPAVHRWSCKILKRYKNAKYTKSKYAKTQIHRGDTRDGGGGGLRLVFPNFAVETLKGNILDVNRRDVDEQAAGHARQDVLLEEKDRRRRRQSQDSLGQSPMGGERQEIWHLPLPTTEKFNIVLSCSGGYRRNS